MATLRIVEYSRMATDTQGNPLPMPQEPPITVQSVTFTTSTQSAAFRSDTRYVSIESSVDSYVLFGTNPTATTTTAGRVPADTIVFRGVDNGTATKLAVYDGSS